MFFNQRGITILSLLIIVFVLSGLYIYAPQVYDSFIVNNIRRLVAANVELVETEIRTELVGRHPILVWNNIDHLIEGLGLRNPVLREQQTRNGWNRPGDVMVTFDGVNTFRVDGIGREGNSLRLNIVIQKP